MLLKKTLEISLKIKGMFRFICKRRWPHSYHYQITTDAIPIKREKAAFLITILERVSDIYATLPTFVGNKTLFLWK